MKKKEKQIRVFERDDDEKYIRTNYILHKEYLGKKKITTQDLAVYCSLSVFEMENPFYKPTIKEIAKITNVSEKTIKRSVERLSSYNIITVERTKNSRGYYSANIYRFNSTNKWKKTPYKEISGHRSTEEKTTKRNLSPGVSVTPPRAYKGKREYANCEHKGKTLRAELQHSEPSVPQVGGGLRPQPLQDFSKPIQNDLKKLLDDTRPLDEQAKDYKPSSMLLSSMIEKLEEFTGSKLDGKVEKNRGLAYHTVTKKLIPLWLEQEKKREELVGKIDENIYKDHLPRRRLPTDEELLSEFCGILDNSSQWWADKIVDMSFFYNNFIKIYSNEHF